MALQNVDTRPLRIIIVGGGIAGLASAIALRASNRQIIVLEQSRLNREIGATISLQPNASKILEKGFGMKDILTKAGALRDEGFNIYTTEGKLQAKIPLTSKTEYGADRMIYHRMDLHEALKEYATSSEGQGQPVEIRTSSCVNSCDTASGTVSLSDGSVLQGDIVIGADGIKSNLRKCVLGQEVQAQPTGLAAYRLMVKTSELEKYEDFCRVIDPRKPYTSMVMGHDRRMIMGPARGGDVYSLVALVPDQKPVDSGNTWNSKGDFDTLMKEYEEFPDWVKAPFRLAGEDIGLWQLRDTEPLSKWHSGRVILIGDACHAMLPTQGQGASQAIEDAEALGAYLSDVDSTFSADQVESRLQEIFDARYERATTVQKYSREAARPATEKGDATIKMNPAEFMDYNCLYNGAKDWVTRKGGNIAPAVKVL